MPGLTEQEADALFAPLAGTKRVGLAISGGADSLALLLLAADWASRAGVTAIVYSVDHGLRPEAADEVKMVCAVAGKLGLSSRSLRWDGDKPETGIQAAARAARYRLLAAAMAADEVKVMLTAHHLADQAETVLMRLAHGSGIEGLRGMQAFSTIEGCRLFRPLLGVEPDDLEAMVHAAGLTPINDPSNDNAHYERVRWRQMLPALAEMGLDARRLSLFAQRMADADNALSQMADHAIGRLVHVGPEGDAELPRAGFAALPRAVAVRVLSRVLARVGGDRRPHGLSPVESLVDQLAAGKVSATTLHGCVASGDGVMIRLLPEAGRSNPRG